MGLSWASKQWENYGCEMEWQRISRERGGGIVVYEVLTVESAVMCKWIYISGLKALLYQNEARKPKE